MDKPKKRTVKRKVEDEQTSAKKPKLAPKTQKKTTNKPSTSAEKSPDPVVDIDLNSTSPKWTDYELLSDLQNLDLEISENVLALLKEGNTIPFIARYRKNVTNNMSPETLRDVKETYDEICALQDRMSTVLKSLQKSGVLTEKLVNSVTSSTSMEELDFVYSPYKSKSKRTLAERAKEVGLEPAALDLLYCTSSKINVSDFVNEDVPSEKDVIAGIVHIIASIIATDSDTLKFLRDLRSRTNFEVSTKKCVKKSKKSDPNIDESKFDNYNDFKITTKYIKPHQVLAINRGENLKVLTVKITVPDYIHRSFEKHCQSKLKAFGNNQRVDIINQAIQDSYTRLVQPLIIREVRSELNSKAEKSSCEVFSLNLKHLLLAPPVKGKPILGIDPGFKNGCKLALVSPVGTLVGSNIIYPHTKSQQRDADVVKKLLLEHQCDLIALGNGTACRQTEQWLTELMNNNFFAPLDVKYTIVNEDGASIYSCSPEAKKEFGDLDVNLISAASLARRVQNPLAELVKVEPKHLGVGMYQHDLKKKQLEVGLNEVVSECVSFVGVDLNTASQCLLRHIAGLSDKRATQIIQHREKNGPFVSRPQLLKVTGIGEKTYQQCVGFLRVGPSNKNEETQFYKKTGTSKFDLTDIHPESYTLASKLITKTFNLSTKDLGTPQLITSVKQRLATLDKEKLCKELGSDQQTIDQILDSLAKPLNYDLRSDLSAEPLFKKGLMHIEDLKSDTILTGRVSNVTHFGCFVDIGVGCNGLVHVSAYGGLQPQIGDRLEVKVVSVDLNKKRIGLRALKKL